MFPAMFTAPSASERPGTPPDQTPTAEMFPARGSARCRYRRFQVGTGPSLVRPSVDDPRRAQDTARVRTESRSPRTGEDQRWAARQHPAQQEPGRRARSQETLIREHGGERARRGRAQMAGAAGRTFKLVSGAFHVRRPLGCRRVPSQDAPCVAPAAAGGAGAASWPVRNIPPIVYYKHRLRGFASPLPAKWSPLSEEIDPVG